MTSLCPSDEDLLAAATGDPGSSQFIQHADNCSNCQQRLKQLRNEIDALRSFGNPSNATDSTYLLAASVSDSMKSASRPRPERIGRYSILDELGSGGQADVYLVVDLELGRPSVLKLARRPPHDDDAHRDAVIAEGKLLASLDHPGLLRVFDAGVYSGRPYLVLEHVPGRNLEQLYDQQLPSADEAARLVTDVAQVLEYAHRRGVVHGDVTPRNIMIGSDGRTKLIDFGLARLENIWQDATVASGGTPEFLPPEMITGKTERRATPASDMFGLAATLYWLLTGEGPFAAADVNSALERARRGDINFARLRTRRIPARLARHCEAGLAIDPGQRPSASVFVRRLERASGIYFGFRPGALVIVLLVCILLIVEARRFVVDFLQPQVAERSIVQSVPEILVVRSNDVVNLSNVLPLRTGDRIEIAFDVSPNETVVMVWLDAAGKLQILSTARTLGEKVDHVKYPRAERLATVDPAEGTDLIFVCRGDDVAESTLRSCFLNETPPPLPDNVFIQLRRSQVEPRGPLPPRSAEAAQVERVGDFMKQIDARLRRHFKGVRGLAVPHRKAADEED